MMKKDKQINKLFEDYAQQLLPEDLTSKARVAARDADAERRASPRSKGFFKRHAAMFSAIVPLCCVLIVAVVLMTSPMFYQNTSELPLPPSGGTSEPGGSSGPSGTTPGTPGTSDPATPDHGSSSGSGSSGGTAGGAPSEPAEGQPPEGSSFVYYSLSQLTSRFIQPDDAESFGRFSQLQGAFDVVSQSYIGYFSGDGLRLVRLELLVNIDGRQLQMTLQTELNGFVLDDLADRYLPIADGFVADNGQGFAAFDKVHCYADFDGSAADAQKVVTFLFGENK